MMAHANTFPDVSVTPPSRRLQVLGAVAVSALALAGVTWWESRVGSLTTVQPFPEPYADQPPGAPPDGSQGGPPAAAP